MIRFATLAGVVITALLAGAQPAEPPSPEPLVRFLLPYIDSTVVQDQLALTAEQTKTLLAHRQAQWDEVYALPSTRAARTAAARDAATVALFKRVLKPEQHKRAVQLAIRELWNGPYQSGPLPVDNGHARVPANALVQHPELAAALKLTDEQKTIVTALRPTSRPASGRRGGSPTAVYLTPSQVVIAKALLGPPNGQTLYLREDPRTLALQSSESLGLVGLTQVKDVRAHLGITPAQEAELTLLARSDSSGGRGNGPGDALISPSAQTKVADILADERRAAVAVILKPDQVARLEQIHRRTRSSGGDASNASLVLYPEVEVDLGGYTPEQNRQIDAAVVGYNAAIETAVRAGSGFEATEKAIAAAIAARDRAYLAVLTPAQARKLKELYGEPFTGSTQPEGSVGAPDGGFLGGQPGGGFPGGWGSDPRSVQDPTFGNYVHELTLIGRDPGLAIELKLTAEQVKKLRYAAFEYYEKYGGSPTGWSSAVLTNPAVREYVAKSLKEALAPEQGKRFREVMLQCRENGGTGGGTGIRSAVGYPGVAEEIHLTAEQKSQLFGGVIPARVLTDDQKAAVRAMLGEPYKDLATLTRGGVTAESERRSRERQFGRYTVELSLVAWNSTVLQELKLTDDQLKKLRSASFEYAEQFGTGTGTSPAVAATDAAVAFVAKSLTDTLTPPQAKRFREIMLQHRERGAAERGFGAPLRAASSAVSYPGVADEVKLTAEQKDKLLDGVAPAEVLAAEQKATIRALLGEPFAKLAAIPSTGRGGFGGGNPWGEPWGESGRAGGRRATAAIPVVLTLPWEALTLTPDQGEKLAAAANRYVTATLADSQLSRRGSGGGTVVASPRVTAATESLEKDVSDILTAGQKTRIGTLVLQQFAAANGLQVALARSDITKHVKLTAEQSRMIAAREAELRKFADLVEAAGIDTDKQEMVYGVLQDRLDARIVALLTAEQNAAWTELIGAPWPGFRKAGLTSVRRGGPSR